MRSPAVYYVVQWSDGHLFIENAADQEEAITPQVGMKYHIPFNCLYEGGTWDPEPETKEIGIVVHVFDRNISRLLEAINVLMIDSTAFLNLCNGLLNAGRQEINN